MNYFKDYELMSEDTEQVLLAPGFLEICNMTRHQAGQPFIVNSCCRTEKLNETIGGHPRSLHLIENPYWKDIEGNPLNTCAMDIARLHRNKMHSVMAALFRFNWSVIVYEEHIHIDQRTKYLGLPKIFMTNFNGDLV